MPSLSTLARSVATFTEGTLVNAETITVCGKAYTFLATLLDVDGNVHIGADDEATLTNLVAAVNLSNEGETAVGAGTDYAASMTINPHAYATIAGTGPAIVTFVSKVPGLIGDFLPLAEASGGTISGAVFASGAGSMATAIEEIRDGGQVNSDVLNALDQIDGSALGESPLPV